MHKNIIMKSKNITLNCERFISVKSVWIFSENERNALSSVAIEFGNGTCWSSLGEMVMHFLIRIFGTQCIRILVL